jgi:HTH-type transcriptional regulator/antitoxin HigA
MDNLVPAEVFSPGEFIAEELNARGWSISEFADMLSISASELNLIVSGSRAIGREMAKAIGDAFGTSAEVWLNLETAYRRKG